ARPPRKGTETIDHPERLWGRGERITPAHLRFFPKSEKFLVGLARLPARCGWSVRDRMSPSIRIGVLSWPRRVAMRERAARARHLIRVGNARKERAIAHLHTLAPSEIRLINVWNRFFSANGDIRVFGANIFLPVQPASVSYRRGPRRCKD